MVVPVLLRHRARPGGYEKYRDDFARLIWKLASPKWNFDDATFARSAASLANPDHVSIVIHNYRWRLGLAEGEPSTRSWRRGSPRLRASPFRRSRSKAMPTARPIPILAAMPGSSRAATRTGSFRADRAQPAAGGAEGIRRRNHRSGAPVAVHPTRGGRSMNVFRVAVPVHARGLRTGTRHRSRA